MRVLVTGHEGYIGAVMTGVLADAGHEVVGLDSGLYSGCDLGPAPASVPVVARDVRDVTADDLRGIDAVVHLAAISNDPIGQLNPDVTYAINHRASVRLAELAREAGASRFVFASSCSLYGAGSGEGLLDEHADFLPVTAYGESKVFGERDIAPLATDDFSPTFMRNATVYGASPRLRGDVVVNNLTGLGFTTGKVVLKSDGSPWRPLVHVRDVCRVAAAILAAPRDRIHNLAVNVGRSTENYRIREVAEIVHDAIPGSELRIADGAGPDLRNYRVDCSLLEELLPDAVPTMTVADGVRELLDAFTAHGLTAEQLEGPRYTRLARISELATSGRLDDDLRWRDA